MIPAGLRIALRHLTVIPIADRGEETAAGRAGSLAWFPVVGLMLGSVLCVAVQLPIPPLPRAAVVLGLWIGLTGGLHEDGFMDCCDAAFAPASRERRLEILKDPHLGSHGVSGGVVLLLLRFALLASVPAGAVLVAPIAGRWAMVWTLARGRPARATGLGARYAEAARWGPASAVAAAALSGVALVASPARTGVAIALAAITAGACALFLDRRFGGFTGDAHGGVGIVAETAALLGFVEFV